MLERVVSRRGKYCPAATARTSADKKRKIVPLPLTSSRSLDAIYDVGKQDMLRTDCLFTALCAVEGVSPPDSPTTHLRRLAVPSPHWPEKRKSFSRKLLGSTLTSVNWLELHTRRTILHDI